MTLRVAKYGGELTNLVNLGWAHPLRERPLASTLRTSSRQGKARPRLAAMRDEDPWAYAMPRDLTVTLRTRVITFCPSDVAAY